ncbi:MAG TPA: hydantoinase/oxoprolinase family protein [Ilumatobacteraceae bacterium]|nr:hydantoinase/oxoprolinase family protein [Ilumatobacteraceae bacterium]
MPEATDRPGPPSQIRIGVDVGGTFTKAIAFDLTEGRVIARSALPTTHTEVGGPAAGVVRVTADVAAQVGPERVQLVTHSTTQAVNAMLEGDVGMVGVLALGRRPDLRRAAKRTRLEGLELAPGKPLPVVAELVDVTDGFDESVIDAALDRLVAGGARSICVAEAFAPDDGSAERKAVARALSRGLPSCGSAEMTGLYGLELRTVTAALNASILPIALQTAQHVEDGVRAAGVVAPVMVMRGDGGAIDSSGLRREPARTLYSGPAASVAGVLRTMRLDDAVIVEVGGTSTNVAAVKAGRPALSYVRVASHATAVRALDVRVVGVAGGSMLRARRGRLHGVGPRSAHVGGMPYSCYLDPAELEGLSIEVVAPRAGDPAEYVVAKLADGRRAAITNTCAAVALDVVHDGDHAARHAHRDSAVLALAAAGALLRLDGAEVARRMLVASAQAIGALVAAVCKDYSLRSPRLIAVGGGAGGVARFVAKEMNLECYIPEHAEVISSIGDALSFVLVERERSVIEPTLADGEALAAEAQEACLTAGAAASSIDVRVEYDREHSTLRASATGMVGLASGAMPGRAPLSASEVVAVAGHRGYSDPIGFGHSWVARRGPASGPSTVLLLDRYGDVVAEGSGDFLAGSEVRAPALESLVGKYTHRHLGSERKPTVWLLGASRIVALTSAAAVEAVRTNLTSADSDAAQAVVVTGG